MQHSKKQMSLALKCWGINKFSMAFLIQARNVMNLKSNAYRKILTIGTCVSILVSTSSCNKSTKLLHTMFGKITNELRLIQVYDNKSV